MLPRISLFLAFSVTMVSEIFDGFGLVSSICTFISLFYDFDTNKISADSRLIKSNGTNTRCHADRLHKLFKM